MEIISSRLITALHQMGLSHHDAKVYSALVFLNSGGAKELIDFVQISKPSVYESLQRLEERGLIVKKQLKPAVFIPVSPRVAMDILILEHSRASDIALGELEELGRNRKKDPEDDAIWTVFGEKIIRHQIREMITSAESHFECIMGEKYLSFIENLDFKTSGLIYLITEDSAILKRSEEIVQGSDVTVTYLSQEILKKSGFPPGKNPDKLKFFNILNLFEIIVDDKETLSIPPIQVSKTTGLYSTNEVLVLIAAEHMRTLIQHKIPEKVSESDSIKKT